MAYDILVAERYGEALTLEEKHLVKHARDTIHLDQLLDILLLTEPLERFLILSVLTGTIADPS